MSRLPRSQLLRMAERIHQQYLNRASPPPVPVLPVDAWQRCERLLRQGRLAQARDWHLSLRKLQARWPQALRVLRQELTCSDHDAVSLAPPSLRDLYDELQALEQEFGSVTCDLRRAVLSVETGSIVLETIDLGSFAIQLEVSGLPTAGWYRVVALDPNPASTNPAVTHPHLLDGQLCVGDARSGIQRALTDGRLSDFFLIVRQVLRTYNPGNAYVGLDDWENVTCSECDDLVQANELHQCDFCPTSLCGACQQTCGECPATLCSDCGDPCEECRQLLCPNCQQSCSACGTVCCANCRDEEALCPPCSAAAAAESSDHDSTEPLESELSPDTEPPPY